MQTVADEWSRVIKNFNSLTALILNEFCNYFLERFAYLLKQITCKVENQLLLLMKF